jgi:hypothetical protein
LGLIDYCGLKDGYIKRKEAAKRLSLFVVNELPEIKQRPEFSCKFSDIKNLPEVTQEYIKLSCKLAFM